MASPNLVHTNKFSYQVENLKISQNKVFYTDSLRQKYAQTLSSIMETMQGFLRSRYQNLNTQIGFNTEQELYIIFQQILSERRGLFESIVVRKILVTLWQAVRNIYESQKIRQAMQEKVGPQPRLSYCDEVLLQVSLYARLEILSRGRHIYEPYFIDFENTGAKFESQFPLH